MLVSRPFFSTYNRIEDAVKCCLPPLRERDEIRWIDARESRQLRKFPVVSGDGYD